MIAEQFTLPLLEWFYVQGRKNLPWQSPRSAYRVWISEIMLQQTQVQAVIPYFNRFIARFPNLQELALANEDEVLAYWSGLGYYSRARNLHQAALILYHQYQEKFPSTVEELVQLPGIGESTAAAIVSLAFNQPATILDGNVIRVLSRYFLVSGTPDKAKVKQQLWKLAKQCTPQEENASYTQAIMDLGALCCTNKNPHCLSCPLQKTCLAHLKQLTENYPNKKKPKAKPVKKQFFILLHTTESSIYLIKNPSKGLWGGLWNLMTLEEHYCPVDYLKENYALEIESQQELLSLKHTFTHFQLHINALSFHIKSKKNLCSLPESGQWFTADEIAHLGLPKPVNVIIQRFYNG